MALVRARQANKVKDQFIANISHEIRTPITSIIGFADRLRESLGRGLKSDEEGYFKSINRNSKRLVRTVDAILNVSQIEAGTLQLNPKQIHLNMFCSSICRELTPMAQNNDPSNSIFMPASATHHITQTNAPYNT